MTFQIGFTLFMLGCASISNHISAQSLNFTSSLQSRNRSYTCSGDVATFMCAGVGNDLSFYAPPLVNLSSSIRYFRGNPLGQGALQNSFATNLISTTLPEMVAELTVQSNIPVQELTVRCIVRSPQVEKEAIYRREGNLQDVSSTEIAQGPSGFSSGSVVISWTGISGDFDLSHYTIELFVDGTRSSSETQQVSSDSFSTQFSAPRGSSVQAKIIVNSACGRSTAGVLTKTVVIASTSIDLAIAFFVILALAVFALVIAVGILSGILCCNKERS